MYTVAMLGTTKFVTFVINKIVDLRSFFVLFFCDFVLSSIHRRVYRLISLDGRIVIITSSRVSLSLYRRVYRVHYIITCIVIIVSSNGRCLRDTDRRRSASDSVIVQSYFSGITLVRHLSVCAGETRTRVEQLLAGLSFGF
jgi:hypothetical protein